MNILQWFCRHEFMLKDLTMTGIPVQEEPKINAGYDAWSQYYQNRTKHPSHTQRVKWPCHKCDKVFYAHCGLDISPHYGPIVAPENKEKKEPPIYLKVLAKIVEIIPTGKSK